MTTSAALALLSLALAPAPPEAEAEAPAGGGVAVVVSIPDESASLRSLAAGVVDVAEERWGLLEPPVRPEPAKLCQADNLCLIKLAREQGASHLLVVGVATLSEDEVVVSLQLFDAESSSEIMSFTDVVTPGAEPAKLGRSLAEEQLSAVEDVPSPEEVEPQWAPPPGPEIDRYRGLSVLAIAGWSVVGAGAFVAGAGLAVGAVQTSGAVPGLGPQLRDVTAVASGGVALSLVGAGLAVVATDLFLR